MNEKMEILKNFLPVELCRIVLKYAREPKRKRSNSDTDIYMIKKRRDKHFQKYYVKMY